MKKQKIRAQEKERGQLANDATSSVYDQYLRCILSVTNLHVCFIISPRFSLVGVKNREEIHCFLILNESVTDGPTDMPTDPLIEMRGRI